MPTKDPEKQREYARRYRERHIDEVRARDAEKSKAYYAENRENVLEKKRLYDAEHAEEIRARKKAYRAANRDKIRTQKQQSRQRHPETSKEYLKRWRRENPEKARANWLRRQQLLRAAEGSHTLAHIQEIYRAQNGTCPGCQCDLGDKYEIDHILAIAKGGSKWPSNLQLLCRPCNREKKDRDMMEFLRAKQATS